MTKNVLFLQLFEGIWTAGVGSFTITNEGICDNNAECINLRLKKVSCGIALHAIFLLASLYGVCTSKIRDVTYCSVKILAMIPGRKQNSSTIRYFVGF